VPSGRKIAERLPIIRSTVPSNRDAVHSYERRDGPLPRHPYHVLTSSIGAYLDARSIAYRVSVTRFNGNKSAALRAMIHYAAFPFVVGAIVRRRNPF
jgi:hypothetical protein